MEQQLKGSPWHQRLLEQGFMPDFAALPTEYSEKNNRSALQNINFVREKVKEWEKGGFVERRTERAWCNSPLTVSDKKDLETGKIKKRLCLDMSRHVNKFLNKHHTNYEDLPSTACLYEKGDHMCVFDLENQYFHVKLAEGAKKFFGFSVPDDLGGETVYNFTVMVYGFAAAGSVVTRLIKPLQGYLHNKGIRSAIYMDDGQVVGSTVEETRQAMQQAVDTFAKAGWNIQWAKTSLEPEQDVKYLGFHIQLKTTEYTAAAEKEADIIEGVQQLIEEGRQGRPVKTRTLAKTVGRLVALRTSHGPVLHVATRQVQCKMGVEAMQNGWDGEVMLEGREVAELEWVKKNLQSFNGRGIRNEKADEVTWVAEHGRWSEKHHKLASLTQQANLEKDHTAVVLKKCGQVEMVTDLPGGTNTMAVVKGVEELWEIQKRLAALPDGQVTDSWKKVLWVTGSRNCYNFLKQGARWETIRQEIMQVRWLEKAKKAEIVAVWDTKNVEEVKEADRWSKASASTDEWGLCTEDREAACEELGIRPTIDSFASSENNACEKFFSRWPQSGSVGVNFFAQQLEQDEVYYCCPPVKEVGHMLRRLDKFAGVKALIIIPAWEGSVYWSLLRTGDRFIDKVLKHKIWMPTCKDTSQQKSLFSYNNTRMLAAVYISGRELRNR